MRMDLQLGRGMPGDAPVDGRAHCAGEDAGGVLCLDVWRHLFGNPAVPAAAWTEFLEGPAEEVRRNVGWRSVPYNRVTGWVAPTVTRKAGSPPG